MSLVTTYRHLFRLAGRGYVVVAFVGRLPLAMGRLGALLLVANATGSYGTGGVVAGSMALANAVGSPIAGALADRLGQRRVVLIQSLTGAAGLVVLVVLSDQQAPWGWQAFAAGGTGIVLPQIGPLARVRWRPIAAARATVDDDHRQLIDAAFSYEGAADEASFVLGPALIGLGVSLINPGAALLLAAAMLAVFGSLFALDGTASLMRGASGLRQAAAFGRLVTPAVGALSGGQLLIGVFFGSAQTGTTALARSEGMLGAAGLLHALLGVGSVLAGMAVASLPSTFSYPSRLVAFSAGLAALSTPLVVVGSLEGLGAALLVLGVAVAPFMITAFTLAERVTPPELSATTMTLLAGVTVLGWAVGATIAGQCADAGGHRAAFAVTLGAAVIALVLAVASRHILAAAERADQAGPSASSRNVPAAP
jgi:MFS family permease